MTTRARSWPSALAALALSGCCSFEIDLGEPARRDEPAEDAAEVHLGDAAYPAGNPEPPVEHPWWVPQLDPEKYRLGYKLPERQARELSEAYRQWAARMGHRRVSPERFQWRPPPSCLGGLHCVYQQLDDQDGAAIAPISALFIERARSAKLTAGEAAALIVTFVQEIEYRIPEDEPFGVLPPALVVRGRWGDCDSKSLLAHMLLRALGIPSVLISSEAHRHTMLGVALPAPGSSFEWRARRYAFVETTAPRSPIGHINPKLLSPNDWKVVPLRSTATGYALPEAAGEAGERPAGTRRNPVATPVGPVRRR